MSSALTLCQESAVGRHDIRTGPEQTYNTDYIEGNGFLVNPCTASDCICAKDILLQLKEQVIDNLSTNNKRAILELDVRGASDIVSHAAILQRLSDANCGTKMDGYVSSFLTGRTASLRVAHHKTEKINKLEQGSP
ncbi:hypothetical protein HPB50_011438 [Hyalomma asiaticum]|uniref:Uncharacterized protein n=1 Tax=Hyalomma asiaticum TaxID=266040 RepID=A0ACB7SPN1_HYAAI|nr:hypothetical protein HPB50_011438 [Hyalomma asiaticum]